MKLIFLIVCHKVTPSLLYNLKKFSTFKNSKILVHIDKKSNFGENELLKADNIFYMKEHFDIRWGSVSQVITTYQMMLEIKNEEFDYLSLMSGEDLFIRSEEEFVSFLKSHNGQEFIGVINDNNTFYDPKDRFLYKYSSSFFNPNPTFTNKFFMLFNTLLFKLGFLKNKKKQPYKNFYKGSNWFTISKKTVELIINDIEKKELLDYFKNSFCIDEVIFQTIIVNNSFLNRIYLINDNVSDNKMSLRYINWTDGPEYPKLLKKKDLMQKFDNDIFFVRKVSPAVKEEDLVTLFGKEKNESTIF